MEEWQVPVLLFAGSLIFFFTIIYLHDKGKGREKERRASSAGKSVLIIALLALSGLAGYLYNQSNLQMNQLDALKQQVVDLQSKMGEKDFLNLQYGTTITKLQTQLSEYEKSATNFQQSYQTLQQNYQNMQNQREEWRTRCSNLQTQYDQLKQSYDTLQTENKELRELLNKYEKVPTGYYSTSEFPHHNNNYEELVSFLENEFRMPKGYREGVFDCSEMSAYTEWALQNSGFDAYIAVGKTPWNTSSGHHAWVIVITSEYKVAVEATRSPPLIVYKGQSGYENYYGGYDKLYSNIYQVIKGLGSGEECNWWEGYWGFK